MYLYILCSGIVHQDISLLFMCITFCFCRRVGVFKTFAQRERERDREKEREKLFKILFKLHAHCIFDFFSFLLLFLHYHNIPFRIPCFVFKERARQLITIVYLWLPSSSMTQIRESKLHREINKPTVSL